MRETETKVLPVLEMSCAVCAGNVESTVQALSGVEKASVNFAAGTLTVTYNFGGYASCCAGCRI